MKLVTARLQAPESSLRSRAPASSARKRFALAGLALATAGALGAPALARTFALPIEASLGAFLAIGLVVLGWLLGRHVDSLTEQSLEDPVTRVGNRRHWETRLSAEVSRAVSSRMPLSLLVVDVDNLKKLNDTHGHGAGDRALSLVGAVLRDTCRSRDVAARFGGDEFVLLLPRTRASEARVVAERIRFELQRRRKAAGMPLDRELTVSIGVADLASASEPRGAALFDSADQALYAAKQAGRDRIEVKQRPALRGPSSVIVLDEHRRKRSGVVSA